MYDGSDVLEAALCLVALEKGGARPVCLAPDAEQLHTVDHLSGEEVEGETRSVVAEAARLGRGRVTALSGFWSGDLQGLLIPGGQGVPKNLATGFMRRGERREVKPDVRGLLDDLTGRKRPIGAVSLGGDLLRLYFGDELEEQDLSAPPTRAFVDEERRTIWTPGFLTGTGIAEVAEGIEDLVHRLLRLASAGLPVVP